MPLTRKWTIWWALFGHANQVFWRKWHSIQTWHLAKPRRRCHNWIGSREQPRLGVRVWDRISPSSAALSHPAGWPSPSAKAKPQGRPSCSLLHDVMPLSPNIRGTKGSSLAFPHLEEWEHRGSRGDELPPKGPAPGREGRQMSVKPRWAACPGCP